jgi:hypothetical protein
MLNGAGLQGQLRDKVLAECVMTAIELSSRRLNFKSPFKLLPGVGLILHTSLKIFGEIVVATTKHAIQAKLINQGSTCIFVGYAENHSKHVYRKLNLKAKAIINSSDIIWSRRKHKK